MRKAKENSKSCTLSVKVNKAFETEVDKYAEEMGLSRSKLIRVALENYFGEAKKSV